MKKQLFLLILPLTLFMASCGGSTIMNIAATGKPYEIFVVTEKPVWKGEVGDSIRKITNQEVQWINQPEPIFDVYNITPQAFNDITRRHRNLLFVKIKPDADSSSMEIKQDLWSTGQVVIDVVAQNEEAAAEYLGENAETIVDFLNIVEQKRMVSRAKKHNDTYIENLIQKKFGFKMTFPEGYRVANDTTNFLWLTYEMPISSQGVVIYTYDMPQAGVKLDFVKQRNDAVRQIPGPVDGSYMSTDTMFYPETKPVEINGQVWAETHGYWRVEGDFMGGSFINYTTQDVKSGRYIGIDLYVYSPSPKYPKRNYMRQLESLMKGVVIK